MTLNMSLLGEFLLWLLALMGHLALCFAFSNRIHSLAMPRWLNRTLERLCMLLVLGGIAIWAWIGFAPLGSWPSVSRVLNASLPFAAYVVLCLEMVCFTSAVWLIRRWLDRNPSQVASEQSRHVDVVGSIGERPIGDWVTQLLDRVPGNQMFELEVQEKVLVVPELPAGLDGFSIAHISDLHFTGRIKRSYFDCLIDQAAQMRADLIAITGDIFDNLECLAWADATLGRLAAPHGVFYILGNHERRMKDKVADVRATLDGLGMVDVSRQPHATQIDGCRLLLAGNERPWFRDEVDATPEQLRTADYRILLSHSPDQLRWAMRRGYDLMLAGHCHGGQIRLPVIGPFVTPSKYGVRYSCGTFFQPPVLMHVSRGVSGDVPLRINCRPEITKITLRVD